jgi:poly [ADP-ribose] polymerase
MSTGTDDTLVVTGKKVCKMVYVAVDDGKTQQSNKFYNMYEQDDGDFIAEWGRVDSTAASKTYPMLKWDAIVKKKTKKGYKEVTHLFAEVVDNGPSKVVDIKDKSVKMLMDRLQGYANKSIQENYTVSSRAVTQAQIDDAQATLDAIVAQAGARKSVDKLNDSLLELFHIIPRRMKDVRHHLFEGNKITKITLPEIQKVIGDEQDTLDVMAGQVLINDGTQIDEAEDQHQDLLAMLGLEVVEGTQEDWNYVQDKMGSNASQVKAVHMIQHIATQKRFDGHTEQADDKHVRHFFHGSRNQNWLNIISTGLMIRPAGAIHTGSMFGDGIYFADKAQKSIGYTSLRGSYWSGGRDNTGYLAMFAVHTGKWKKIRHHNSSCYRLSKSVLDREGYDSVFAQGGADLRNNEYIVYAGQQCTISHLIELG